MVLLVPPFILPPGNALDERLDGQIDPRIGEGVDAVGGLYRPERRQGRDVTIPNDMPMVLEASSSSSDSSAACFLFRPRLCRSMTSVLRKATSLSAVTRSPSLFLARPTTSVSLLLPWRDRRRMIDHTANSSCLDL